MKIDKNDFIQMQDKYKKEVKKGKPAKNKKGDVTNQTDWIFFDRETLERVLSKADSDPKKGGIKFYIGEYTEEVAKKYHPQDPEAYEGTLTIIMEPISTLSSSEDLGGDFENAGQQCPPKCIL
ncbi:molecular chaperone DnaK [Algoriphagus sp. CAU 1675]|uniref:molecular chaperone DnaK n=1 Tax=Algoriphagus sp. CAU 1675 TaxID=3032597 RepID=UPI0023DC5941|nr:molecular chaperone DnaK [Algoriphagus sp. CAU 1675]MDF2156616.1 molecular chaperone DnaK [Algoriphagus sp. CAU 1675]